MRLQIGDRVEVKSNWTSMVYEGDQGVVMEIGVYGEVVVQLDKNLRILDARSKFRFIQGIRKLPVPTRQRWWKWK